MAFLFPRIYNWAMAKRLLDPWFGAHFIGEIDPDLSYHWIDSIDRAQGIFLWCPCGYGKAEFPLDGGRPHGILLPFSNPKNAPVPPDDFNRQKDGRTPRWHIFGTCLDNLSLSPSIAIGKPECWHGYITNGEITP